MSSIFALFIITQLTVFSWCSLVSQSSISICEAGKSNEPNNTDGTTCEKKMVVSLVLSGKQGETESLYANVDSVYEEGQQELSKLRQPFRIEISKTRVLSSYRVFYIGSANAKPSETFFHKYHCKDDWHLADHELSCGRQYDNSGEAIWDSQGFCCRCYGRYSGGYIERGDQHCNPDDVPGLTGKGTAHCMRFDELW
jgi:hypothetical protein